MVSLILCFITSFMARQISTLPLSSRVGEKLKIDMLTLPLSDAFYMYTYQFRRRKSHDVCIERKMVEETKQKRKYYFIWKEETFDRRSFNANPYSIEIIKMMKKKTVWTNIERKGFPLFSFGEKKNLFQSMRSTTYLCDCFFLDLISQCWASIHTNLNKEIVNENQWTMHQIAN